MKKVLTPSELRRKGMRVLIRELGYTDAVRFMLQFSRGKGDYTKEREKMLAGVTLDDLLTASEKRVGQARKSQRAGRKSA